MNDKLRRFMRGREDINKIQKKWRKYYKKHPNTDIYYQARRPQYREEPKPETEIYKVGIIHRFFSFIWRIIKKTIILLIILYLISYLLEKSNEYNVTKKEIEQEWEYKEKQNLH